MSINSPVRLSLYTRTSRESFADVPFPNNVVNASNRKLLTLDGACLVPSAEVLIVNDNKLDNFYGMISLPRLRCLYADRNSISSFAGMSYQPGLEIVSLEENPICKIPMFRIMALLCIGESLRIINNRAVSEAERAVCQSFGGSNSCVARLVAQGWTNLPRTSNSLSHCLMLESPQKQFYESQIRNKYSVFSSTDMLEWSLQTFVEFFRVEEGIVSFTSEVMSRRVQNNPQQLKHLDDNSTLKEYRPYPSEETLGLRDHSYSGDTIEKSTVVLDNKREGNIHLEKRPPWDYSPVASQQVIMRAAIDSNLTSGATISLAAHADRGGPARALPQGRGLYEENWNKPIGSAKYQAEVDREVAIDIARNFLTRVKHGGSTASLSVPLSSSGHNPPSAIDIETSIQAKQKELESVEEEVRIRKWLRFHQGRSKGRSVNKAFNFVD